MTIIMHIQSCVQLHTFRSATSSMVSNHGQSQGNGCCSGVEAFACGTLLQSQRLVNSFFFPKRLVNILIVLF